jgi:uncharacterized protein DUF397
MKLVDHAQGEMEDQLPRGRDTGWFKSTFSVTANDTCVEVRIITATAVGVRDSKNPGAGTFWVRPDAWTSFLARIGRDESTR